MKSVVTIGLGYIGLPTSALIASKGTPVFGVDINQNVVDTINRGEIHIVEPELDEIVKTAVEKGLLKAGTEAIESDVYLIVVPTPFKGNYEPDISFIETATKKIIPLLKENDLFIIESTSPIGTTEKIRDLIYSKRPDLKDKLFIAYCPERVLPGNIMNELAKNDRVIGGVNKRSTRVAIDFYKQFVSGELHGTNARTAEMCKLTENASRDSQIAFANELSIICDKAKIDVKELIRLANKHPRVNILQPGVGVGGHCIAVDPYFLIHDYPEETNYINKARNVNNYKTKWCIRKINDEILKFELDHGRKPKVVFCGLTYKPNVDDIRESPALTIAKNFKKSYPASLIKYVEPNLSILKDFELLDYKKITKFSDIEFILVNHNQFNTIDFNSPVFFV